MVNINPSRLDPALAALGEQLTAAGADPVHLVVIGGSGLIAIDVIARPTRDVDVIAMVRDDELVTAEPLPPAVVAAAALVARDFDLPPRWLNAGPTRLLEISGPPAGFEDRLIGRDYGPALRISFAGRVDQVHFKLYAAVGRSEPRDAADLRALEPTADELRAAARWARTRDMPGPIDDELARVLAQFGVEDDGRLGD
jgi:hypothetical protein